jgi:hypothetical protein
VHAQVCISCVAVNCNFRQVSCAPCHRPALRSESAVQDESYTPSLISVRAGTHLNDLQEIVKVAFARAVSRAFLSIFCCPTFGSRDLMHLLNLISVHAHALQVDLEQPVGWSTIHLRHSSDADRRRVSCFLVSSVLFCSGSV